MRSKPKQGMTLHTWVATGGKPKARKNAFSKTFTKKK